MDDVIDAPELLENESSNKAELVLLAKLTGRRASSISANVNIEALKTIGKKHG